MQIDFSGLQKAVTDAWEFFSLPILTIFLMLLIARTICPHCLSKLLSIVQSFASRRAWRHPTTYKLMQRYQLLSLLPFITFFLFLLSVHVVRIVTISIGTALPPQVISFPGGLLAHSTSKNDLARLWSYFPDANNLEQLAIAIDNRLSLSGLSNNPGNIVFQPPFFDEVNRIAQKFSVVKFLLVWTIVCLVGAVCIQQKKNERSDKCRISQIGVLFLGWLLILLAMQAYYIAAQVRAIELAGFQKAMAAQVIIVVSSNQTNKPTTQLIEIARKRVDELNIQDYDRQIEWWRLQIVDTNYFRWFNDTFFPKKQNLT